MDIIISGFPLAAAFLAPLSPLLQTARHQRDCPELPDDVWIALGVHRVLEDQPSGRAFLQKADASPAGAPARSSFFAALASPRRLLHAREINEALALRMAASIPDPFAAFPALAEFDLYAGDGHWHAAAAAAAHDRRSESGTKHPTGHLYLLNLRSQAMRHLDVCDPVHKLKEHDLPILKRHPHQVLRGYAPKKRKVIIAWDRACLDFRFWQKAKRAKRALYCHPQQIQYTANALRLQPL